MLGEIKEKVGAEVVNCLMGRTDEEILKFFRFAAGFARKYAISYELEGPMYLVLDNSIVQSFKHRVKDSNRNLQALSYVTFTRFVTGWSDRETYLAVTPAALYEHMGRRGGITNEEVLGALEELQKYFVNTGLRISWVGFNSMEELVGRLAAIHADDIYLTNYFREIEARDWRTDLKAPFGVKIPLGIAYREIPDNLPLKYFSPWYVKFVLASRIERSIIRDSQHDPDARPIGSGELSDALADLNEFNRKGALSGLGDIDMLQICDGSRQYRDRAGFVLVGQTFDRDLDEVLRYRHSYVESKGVEFGTPHAEQQVKDMVNFMFSRPFAEHEKRADWIRPRLKDFVDVIADGCRYAVRK
ncbi:hypothetical protein [Pseudomonas citrulli]|uniref:Uncharacterized protein n=2 Tax=Pseudomonas TaxID=286 RepID=A0A0G3GQJ7_9PSED|nr:hypothetical protein [Pseudomonas sp. K18]AKK01072.1 hypothetical protein VM99_24525 [Pseudomonas chlororaphis]MDO7896319.1 hypothetical protein [Pseudomonas sp. K18]